MRVLLSDASGLTCRQTATQLRAQGHEVHALSAGGVGLAGLTSHVTGLHRVPRFGADPDRWLAATERVIAHAGIDLLIPTQEQVVLLARERDRLRSTGLALAVPPLAAVLAVQDKASASATLAQLGIGQPETVIVRATADLALIAAYPVYLKTPIGTASSGVTLVFTPREAEALLGQGRVLVAQQPANGPLLMAQAVFDDGRLTSFHACQRVEVGPRGGATHKIGVRAPEVAIELARLGGELGWHGALSADVIATASGPQFIDINPRLVEPGNAWRCGIDLVGALVAASLGEPTPDPPGRPGVRTHQSVLSLLGAAQHGRGAVLSEVLAASMHLGRYNGSREELTPSFRDPKARIANIGLAAALVAWPKLARRLADSSVSDYALTPQAFRSITQ